VARISRVQPRGIGEQHELASAQQESHLRGEEVVVSEGDLVSGRRVVLVDHRHAAPLKEATKRGARVEVVDAGRHVRRVQEHLRRMNVVSCQPRLVGPEQGSLPHGRCRLKLIDGARARVEAHELHAERDRA